jgi:hypothetical protein
VSRSSSSPLAAPVAEAVGSPRRDRGWLVVSIGMRSRPARRRPRSRCHNCRCVTCCTTTCTSIQSQDGDDGALTPSLLLMFTVRIEEKEPIYFCLQWTMEGEVAQAPGRRGLRLGAGRRSANHWRLAGSRPTSAPRLFATVLRTQTTSHGNRVDVRARPCGRRLATCTT